MPIGSPTHLYSVFQGTSKAAIGDIVCMWRSAVMYSNWLCRDV